MFSPSQYFRLIKEARLLYKGEGVEKDYGAPSEQDESDDASFEQQNSNESLNLSSDADVEDNVVERDGRAVENISVFTSQLESKEIPIEYDGGQADKALEEAASPGDSSVDFSMDDDVNATQLTSTKAETEPEVVEEEQSIPDGEIKNAISNIFDHANERVYALKGMDLSDAKEAFFEYIKNDNGVDSESIIMVDNFLSDPKSKYAELDKSVQNKIINLQNKIDNFMEKNYGNKPEELQQNKEEAAESGNVPEASNELPEKPFISEKLNAKAAEVREKIGKEQSGKIREMYSDRFKASVKIEASMTKKERVSFEENMSESMDMMIALSPEGLSAVLNAQNTSSPEKFNAIWSKISKADIAILERWGRKNLPKMQEYMSKVDAEVQNQYRELAEAEEPLEAPSETHAELWKSFTELSKGMDANRTKILRNSFMNMPEKRAEAMLNIHRSMSVEEEAVFDDVIIKNAALLKDFSPKGFRAALQLPLATSTEERSAIVARLPESDKKIIMKNWSEEDSEQVNAFLNKVDAQSKPESAGRSAESAPGSAFDNLLQNLNDLVDVNVDDSGFEEPDSELKRAERKSITKELNGEDEEGRSEKVKSMRETTEKNIKVAQNELNTIKIRLEQEKGDIDNDELLSMQERQADLQESAKRLAARGELLSKEFSGEKTAESKEADPEVENAKLVKIEAAQASIDAIMKDNPGMAEQLGVFNIVAKHETERGGPTTPAVMINKDQADTIIGKVMKGKAVQEINAEFLRNIKKEAEKLILPDATKEKEDAETDP